MARAALFPSRMLGAGGRFLLVFALVGVAGACGSSGHGATPAPKSTTSVAATAPSSSVAPSTTTTVPTVQLSGLRTVLSPVGLNVRAQPSTSAPVLGTAAQGVALNVLGHTSVAGGWYKVKGATITGWITANTALSAPGRFATYNSSTNQFAALYPSGWTVGEPIPTKVIFSAPAGAETITVTTAATVAQIGSVPSGDQRVRSEQIVACGITSDLNTYGPPAPAGSPYAVQLRLTLDAQHALGVDADLSSLTELQSVRDFVNSVTFPFPQCAG